MQDNVTQPTHQEDNLKQIFAQLGASITALRQHHGWSLEEAAELAGLTPKKLAAIERGVLYNNINHITKIVERLQGRLIITPEEAPTDPHFQFVEFE